MTAWLHACRADRKTDGVANPERREKPMKVHGYSVAALLVCTVASCVPAEVPTNAVAVGEPIGSYSCIKIGGADDGVEAGRSLCYT